MIKVGMFPSYSGSKWEKIGNPILKLIEFDLEINDIEVVPIKLNQILEPSRLIDLNLDILHIHWPGTIIESIIDNNKFLSKITNKFPFKIKLLSILTSVLDTRIFPNVFIKNVLNSIDSWESEIKKTRIPIVWQIHDISSHHMSSHKLYSIADNYFHKILYGLASGFVHHEVSAKIAVEDTYGLNNKVYTIVHIGDYESIYGNKIDKLLAKQLLDIDLDAKVYLYFGTMRVNRNPTDCLKVFNEVKYKNDILLIAGQGSEYYQRYENSENIKVIPGLLGKKLVATIFSASDYVINDARNYLTSAVVRTAMSYSVPVIAYSYGSTSDMARSAAIFLDDYKSNTDALKEALTFSHNISKKTYQNLVYHAEMRSLERSWNKNGLKLKKLYKGIIRITNHK